MDGSSESIPLEPERRKQQSRSCRFFFRVEKGLLFRVYSKRGEKRNVCNLMKPYGICDRCKQLLLCKRKWRYGFFC